MKTPFTRAERLIAGLYTASIAAVGLLFLFITFPSPGADVLLLIAIIAVGGFLAGYLVMPAILKPDIFSIGRAIAAGCLTTLGSAFFSALVYGLLIALGVDKMWRRILDQTFDIDLALDIVLSFSLEEFIARFLSVITIALVFAIPFSFIGAPATVLLSHRLAKHRAKKPNFDLETFE